MASRHTPMKGRLTRSFGEEEGVDLVVELNAGGYIAVREEPTHRRLKRGEKLPEVRLNPREVMDAGGTEEVGSLADEILAKLESKAAVAKFGEEDSRNPGYSLKVFLLQAIKEVKEDHLTKNERNR